MNRSRKLESKLLALISLIFYASGCGDSENPIAVDLQPADSDPPPYFVIAYSREDTEGSNGLIEGIDLQLLHLVEGESIDYGTVSFGDVELPLEEGPPGSTEREYYHVRLETNLPDFEFQPKFRFDMGNLTLKVIGSPAIEDINRELDVPAIRFMTNVTQGQLVSPMEDWNVEMNRDVFGMEITVQPLDPLQGAPDHGIIEFVQPELTQTLTIPADTLQSVKSMSQGTRYLLRCYFRNALVQVDEFTVRGKHSDTEITLPVFYSSQHTIDFVMEN